MAKPKSPKKNRDTNGKTDPTISTPMPENSQMSSATASEAVAAAPASTTEPNAPAPRKNAKSAKNTNKPELVKTESRSNLVPINLDDEIRQLAYLFSERRGFAPGHETEDWLAAEHEVLDRYHQARAHHAGA